MKKIKKLIVLIILTCSVTDLHAIIIDGKNDAVKNDYVDTMNDFLSNVASASSDLNQALIFLKAGDRLKAKKIITKILSKDPANVEALHVSGIIFLEEKRYDNAQVAFEAALSSDMTNPAIISKLGVTRILQGDREKGKRLLNRALALDPDNQLALAYLAWIAETEDQFVLAISYLQKLLIIYNSDKLSDLHITIARLLSRINQNAEVVKFLSPYIDSKNKPNNSLEKQAVVYLIESYIQTFQYAKAESLLKASSVDDAISEVQSIVFTIELLIKQKQYKKASAYADKEANKLPEQAHIIRYSTAQAFFQAQKYSQAIDQMTTVVKILDAGNDKSKLFSGINDLVALYVEAGKQADALQVVQQYVEKYSDSPALLYQMAELQTSAGQYNQANKTLDKLLSSKPGSANANYLKGIVARRQKQYINAEKWFSKVNDIAPKNEQAWVQRAGNFIDAGNMDQAIKILSSAVNTNKTSAVLWFEYGALLTDTGRYQDAVKAYKVVLSYYPNHLPSTANLAGALLELEANAPEALFYAERAYKMAPSDTILQLNYLEALLINKQYKEVLAEAKKLKSDLVSFGRYHYYIGVSLLNTGNKEGGIKELNIAKKSNNLDKKYKAKIDRLLNSN